jgi:2-polyprenyl-6-hydroxyphenyl methylase/3-demethylubiquinone-9 3-methyltransferase
MTSTPDYFENHRHKLRFPWTLYHRPIVSALGAALGKSPGPEVLNVGSGPFFELSELDARDRKITVCDVDPRAIELARELHDGLLAGADVIQADAPLPYPNDRFDLVVSMEVVEHLTDPGPWLRELLRVTKPDGMLFLTTPNYASKGLVTIERTALELVARAQGFSRKALHPSKLTPATLQALLESAGFCRIDLDILAFGWVLAAWGRKPRSA